MIDPQLEPYLAPFRDALRECRRLYGEAARHCLRECPHLLDEKPHAFSARMDRLHQGLVVKVVATVAASDRKLSANEQVLGEILIEHLWQKHLQGEKLRQAFAHLHEKSVSLSWYGLLRPFEQYPPLRKMVGQLETVVMRLANLVAKADGKISSDEAAVLRSLQHELEVHLRPIRLEDDVEPINGSQIVVDPPPELGGGVVKKPAASSAEKSEQPSLEETLAELEALIGLAGIKREVRTLTNYLAMQKQRTAAGLPASSMSLHMAFLGNPGTGKTTVARLIGRILGTLGILSQGHLVETDRSGLVGQYAGQTGPKCNAKIDEALGGVLFIDEAYSLVASNEQDAYGQEAIQALLKRMEDQRDELVVILAGYPQEMNTMLRSNPGLTSRINTRLTFDDYAPPELLAIFETLCRSAHFELPETTRRVLLKGLELRFAGRDEHFGNGRLVRNLFESSIRRLANRIAGIAPVTRELLTVLQPEDIPRVNE